MNLHENIHRIKEMMGLTESDPKVGTGKKPKDSDRRLYTDENPTDTVSVKFKTKQDVIDTLNKESFKSKSHQRQSQIINLIHQRLRVASERAKDPDVKKRLKSAFDYIVLKKEASKRKTEKIKEGLHDTSWQNDDGEKNKIVYDYVEGRNTVPNRLPFDIDKLVNSGAVFVTPAIDGDQNSKTYKEWLKEEGSHLITLFNVEHSSKDGWIHKGITKKASTNGFKDNLNDKLYDGKYNQILWSLKKLGINPKDMLIDNKNEMKEQELTEKCWTGYTQKGMKTMFGKRYPNCVKISKIKEDQINNLIHKILQEVKNFDNIQDEDYYGSVEETDFITDDMLNEAEYQGKKVTLNKPFYTPDGPKKRSVYVKNDKGNVVKVNFGDPNMRIKKNSPSHRKSFRARHNCQNPGPKTSSKFWSCRAW